MSIAKILPNINPECHELQSLILIPNYNPMTWILQYVVLQGHKESPRKRSTGPKREKREANKETEPTEKRNEKRPDTPQKDKKRSDKGEEENRRAPNRQRGKYTDEHTTEGGNAPRTTPP